ncbi:PqiA/YebS family transporter subunit [Orbaceae bacterium ESL0727]|nr:PqiA/YebS family transporter subunit [Orbaceae bacterium ESL0727]
MTIDKHQYVLCPHCDLLVQLPDIALSHKAVCPRCHTLLAKNNCHMKLHTTIYAICSLIMLILASGFVFIDIRIVGNFNGVSVFNIPETLYSDNYRFISLLFVLFVLTFPVFNLLIMLLLCCKIPLSKYRKRDLLIVYKKFAHWCMPEIFLVGILVSFVKLMSYGEIGVTSTFLAFCLFIFFYLKAYICFSPEEIWNELASNNYARTPLIVGKTGISQNLRLCRCCHAILPAQSAHCPRCKQRGKIRNLDKMQWTIALLVTSLLIYIPANVFGIMITVIFGSGSSATILDGVIYMWHAGDIPVALIILTASIVIPILKIISLSWLCYFAVAAKRKNKYSCRHMNALYNAVEFIGKWSMIDIFVVSVICALVRNQQMMAIYPDIGIIFFAMVVIVTMIASQQFDPRLIWDQIYIEKSEKREKPDTNGS